MTTYAPFPIFSIEGDAHECGVQHGQLAADCIARTIDSYLGVFGRHSKLSLDQVRERATAFRSQIESIDTAIHAELHGIAEGSHQRIEDIVAINCRTELMYGSSRGSRASTECTTIVALPEATASKGVIVGKNWDWLTSAYETLVVLRIRQQDKPALSLIVEAGMVGRDGFNEDGIMVCGNMLTSSADTGKVGVPIPILRRRILNSRRFYEAIDTLTRSARGASGNYVLAHREGIAIDFETTPESVYPVYPVRGLLTHSNHFQSIAAQTQGVANSYNGDSLYRDFRARQLLEPKIGAITIDDVQSVLRDEFGSPRAICRAPHVYPGQGSTMTIASVVFDLQNEVMHVAPGQPNRSEYMPVYLPGSEAN